MDTQPSRLADTWTFPWPIMDVLIAGKSSIDLNELHVQSVEDAGSFLESYGFNMQLPNDQMRVHAIFVEAIAFIERQLLTAKEWQKGLKPPPEILACDDLRMLLVWASGRTPHSRMLRAWSCAVLRVMHTIAHLEGVNRYVSIEDAREQVMSRFEKYMFRDSKHNLWFGTKDQKVALEKVEWKYRKTRNSIILKLLHKRDNVAETIYDFMGLRIVAKRLCDTMLLVKYLREFHIISFPNCYPARARNNLVDVGRFRTQVETLLEMLKVGSLSEEEFEHMVSRLTAPVRSSSGASARSSAAANPHSSQNYRSIQLTARQLIRMKHPEFLWLEKIQNSLDDPALTEQSRLALRQLVEYVRFNTDVPEDLELRAFFPFEVQILDHKAYTAVLSGDARHDRYKLSQVRAARKRVLHSVLDLTRAKIT